MILGARFALARLLRADMRVPIYVLDVSEYFLRPGDPYQSPEGADWSDNSLRFGLLSRAAALLGSSASPLAWRPDVVHCHDWPSGPVAARLAGEGSACAATVMTVHNLAYQGIFPGRALDALALPLPPGAMNGFEYHGNASFLKAGLMHATRLTTVSPTYAREIQTPELGFGLDALLAERSRDLVGILNGIDPGIWSPVRNPQLARNYGADDLEEKGATKRLVRRSFGLPERDDVPLLGVVARLVEQKGIDLVIEAAAEIIRSPAQIVVLGQGTHGLEDALRALAARHPGEVAARIGYEEPLAHQIIAGSDLFLAPSRFEPCGLTPMHAACCGTPTVAHRTGGLADIVTDATSEALNAGSASGFLFERAAPDALLAAVRRALALYHRPGEWKRLQRSAMARDFGWSAAVPAYKAVYRGAMQARTRAKPGAAGTMRSQSAVHQRGA